MRRIPKTNIDKQQINGVSEFDVKPFSIYDFKDFQYAIDINIGGQTLSAVLDTGSSDVWFLNYQCCSYLNTSDNPLEF